MVEVGLAQIVNIGAHVLVFVLQRLHPRSPQPTNVSFKVDVASCWKPGAAVFNLQGGPPVFIMTIRIPKESACPKLPNLVARVGEDLLKLLSGSLRLEVLCFFRV